MGMNVARLIVDGWAGEERSQERWVMGEEYARSAKAAEEL